VRRTIETNVQARRSASSQQLQQPQRLGLANGIGRVAHTANLVPFHAEDSAHCTYVQTRAHARTEPTCPAGRVMIAAELDSELAMFECVFLEQQAQQADHEQSKKQLRTELSDLAASHLQVSQQRVAAAASLASAIAEHVRLERGCRALEERARQRDIATEAQQAQLAEAERLARRQLADTRARSAAEVSRLSTELTELRRCAETELSAGTEEVRRQTERQLAAVRARERHGDECARELRELEVELRREKERATEARTERARAQEQQVHVRCEGERRLREHVAARAAAAAAAAGGGAAAGLALGGGAAAESVWRGRVQQAQAAILQLKLRAQTLSPPRRPSSCTSASSASASAPALPHHRYRPQ
jgi:hypothetical protein